MATAGGSAASEKYSRLPMIRVRGAALPLVLWLIILLATTISAFALSARIEYLQGRIVADLGAGQELAHAGVDYALSRMWARPMRPAWHADGRRYHWKFGEYVIELDITDERGKVDLNQADQSLLEALLRALKVEPARAIQVAGAIVDWRDEDDLRQPTGGGESRDYKAAGYPYGAKNANFDGVSELQRLLGMDARLYSQIAPLVTVHGISRPDPRFAAAPVLTALGMDASLIISQRQREAASDMLDESVSIGTVPREGIYSVRSQVQMQGGRLAVLRAVVQLVPEVTGGASYIALSWEEGAESR